MSELQTRLLSAHEKDDRKGLIALYTEAADQSNDMIERSFFLTHAFVFALEAGDMRAPLLHDRLREMGRI
ncbi:MULTISPECIES: hypothetical protein [Lentibacter]|jgi:hypothetical protein|uniref:Uncharacterized protein n=1 Tax=Lentibacter algarum TaxID=576131 RepID=A0A1H3LLC3_9RHOB|nr:hypothetical protein [Lentibacter algarum]MCH9824149.1 hypothetical protein [Alphaproteobacteria bacterium]MCO4777693.1 hypothetical protein [Lentibacter algarum]WIF32585.1 hypothetical protein LentiSH36_02135 [Lentibacter algarum]SDY64939.1 hypothetical protein SAMN05444486_1036 [Lentibacter algarum]